MTGKTRRYLDWGLIVAINFMWATQATAIKLIGDNLGPVAIAFLPMILSTLIFLPVLWIQNRRQGRRLSFQWRDARHFLASGLGGLFMVQLTYTLGAQRTLAANAGIIALSIPVFTAVAAALMVHEKFTRVRLISFVLAIGGVVLTSFSDLRSADFGQSRYLAGNLLFLVTCAASAFYNTYCKLLVEKKYTVMEILVYNSVVGSLAALPLLIWVEPFHFDALLNAGPRALAGLAEITFVVYCLAMMLFFSVLKRIDVSQASLGNYLLPFFMSMLGVVVLKESVTGPMLAGGALVLVGTLMASVYEKEIERWMRRG